MAAGRLLCCGDYDPVAVAVADHDPVNDYVNVNHYEFELGLHRLA